MMTFLEIGLITDDPQFAAVVSSYFIDVSKYFPIISLPRMERDDWEFEVFRRVDAARKAGLRRIICRSEDYGLLAPFRSNSRLEFLPLKEPTDLSKFLPMHVPLDTIVVPREQYREGLIIARQSRKKMELVELGGADVALDDKRRADEVVLVERTNEVTDVAAINFAATTNRDIHFFSHAKGHVRRWELEDNFKSLFREASLGSRPIDELCQALESEISRHIEIASIRGRYKAIQFVVESIPYGVLIDDLPVAHLLQLESDLKFIDHINHQHRMEVEPPEAPSYLFVDTQSADLISEIPAIEERLANRHYWGFHLNGRSANRFNFRLIAEHYPYDVLLLSGHGSSPRCRTVEYCFKSRDNQSHTGKFLEYYQFGPVMKEKMQVETKLYPLAFDGILWRDKEGLRQAGIDHLFREFVEAERAKSVNLVSSVDEDPRSIEGLLLSDGVFLGNVRSLASVSNPVVFLNTCGSLLEIGKNMALAGARVCIGTMWSVGDAHAKAMAEEFFSLMPTNSLMDSFTRARSGIKDRSSRLAYVFFGILGSRLKVPEHVEPVKSAAAFGRRILGSLLTALRSYRAGWLTKEEFDAFVSFASMAEKYEQTNIPKERSLRTALSELRKLATTGRDAT